MIHSITAILPVVAAAFTTGANVRRRSRSCMPGEMCGHHQSRAATAPSVSLSVTGSDAAAARHLAKGRRAG
ncbi:hypothetical protein BC828DRAFT_375318 [Blastocladiella britannica]|nr:hypothetical protein BC828DRAFT_375318 [Blastocladiella britannica]